MKRILYLRENKKLFYLFLGGMILPLFFTILVIFVQRIQLGEYFLGIFEKKTLDNLTSYHISTKRSVNAYFVRSVELLETISKSDHFFSPKYISDPGEIDSELQLQLKLNPQFITLAIIDNKGIIRHVVSQEPTVEKLLGQNFSNREYFIQVMKTGKTFISKPIVGSVSKIPQISISVPVVQNGKIISTLNGFITLKQITKDMNVSNALYDKYAILADTDGTVLIGMIPEEDKLINLKNNEPTYEKLTSSSERVYTGDEYNHREERVFAMGEKISIGGNKDVLLLSYLRKSVYENEKRGLDYTIYKIAAYLMFVWIVLNGIVFMILSVLLYKHDKK